MTAFLEKLKELDAGATEGPWIDKPSVHGNKYRYVQIGTDHAYTTLEVLPKDAAIIAFLRNHASAIGRLVEAAELIERCKFTVSTGINPRGYEWCEAWLDEVLPKLRAALSALNKSEEA